MPPSIAEWHRNRLVVDSSAPSDRTLVLAALADSIGYGAIVGRYEFVLRRYVTRLLGSHAQAVDDVLQETFLKAYLNLNDYDQARAFSPWLYRIAHNEAISFLRKLRAQPQAIGRTAASPASPAKPSSSPSPMLPRRAARCLRQPAL